MEALGEFVCSSLGILFMDSCFNMYLYGINVMYTGHCSHRTYYFSYLLAGIKKKKRGVEILYYNKRCIETLSMRN